MVASNDERTQLGHELNRLFMRRGDLETVLEDLNTELAETKQAIQNVRRRLAQMVAPPPRLVQPAPAAPEEEQVVRYT